MQNAQGMCIRHSDKLESPRVLAYFRKALMARKLRISGHDEAAMPYRESALRRSMEFSPKIPRQEKRSPDWELQRRPVTEEGVNPIKTILVLSDSVARRRTFGQIMHEAVNCRIVEASDIAEARTLRRWRMASGCF